MGWWHQYLKCPFHDKGRTPAGFDCWGLLRWVYAHDHPLKHDLPDYLDCYDNTNDRDRLAKVIFEEKELQWREIKAPETPQPFDAVLVRMRGVPMHVGIVTIPGSMIHCGRGVNTTHEPYTATRWKNRILGFYRYE